MGSVFTAPGRVLSRRRLLEAFAQGPLLERQRQDQLGALAREYAQQQWERRQRESEAEEERSYHAGLLANDAPFEMSSPEVASRFGLPVGTKVPRGVLPSLVKDTAADESNAALERLLGKFRTDVTPSPRQIFEERAAGGQPSWERQPYTPTLADLIEVSARSKMPFTPDIWNLAAGSPGQPAGQAGVLLKTAQGDAAKAGAEFTRGPKTAAAEADTELTWQKVQDLLAFRQPRVNVYTSTAEKNRATGQAAVIRANKSSRKGSESGDYGGMSVEVQRLFREVDNADAKLEGGYRTITDEWGEERTLTVPKVTDPRVRADLTKRRTGAIARLQKMGWWEHGSWGKDFRLLPPETAKVAREWRKAGVKDDEITRRLESKRVQW